MQTHNTKNILNILRWLSPHIQFLFQSFHKIFYEYYNKMFVNNKSCYKRWCKNYVKYYNVIFTNNKYKYYDI